MEPFHPRSLHCRPYRGSRTALTHRLLFRNLGDQTSQSFSGIHKFIHPKDKRWPRFNKWHTPPRKLTWNLKKAAWKKKNIYNTTNFSGSILVFFLGGGSNPLFQYDFNDFNVFDSVSLACSRPTGAMGAGARGAEAGGAWRPMRKIFGTKKTKQNAMHFIFLI